MRGSWTSGAVFLAASVAGCTAVLGIDKDYTRVTADGKGGLGGVGGEGTTVATSGSSGSTSGGGGAGGFATTTGTGAGGSGGGTAASTGAGGSGGGTAASTGAGGSGGESTPVAGAGGACTNAGDLATAQSKNIDATVQQCAMSTLGAEPATLNCIKGMTALSVPCATCYDDAVECLINKCLNPCLFDPGSLECKDCQTANCDPALETCSGLGTGACTNVADLVTSESKDIRTIVANCGWDKFGEEPSTRNCIKDTTGLSDPCTTCYDDAIACMVSHCFGECSLFPGSQECDDCANANCGAALEVCSGLAGPRWTFDPGPV